MVVAAPVERVWDAWTTVEGLQFISSKSNVELARGGPYEWFLDLEPDAHGKRGGEGARVLCWVDERSLAFTWTFPPSIPALRDVDETTVVVVDFESADDGATRVDFSQLGWEQGEAWDEGYAYFDRAWGIVLGRLRESLSGGR